MSDFELQDDPWANEPSEASLPSLSQLHQSHTITAASKPQPRRRSQRLEGSSQAPPKALASQPASRAKGQARAEPPEDAERRLDDSNEESDEEVVAKKRRRRRKSCPAEDAEQDGDSIERSIKVSYTVTCVTLSNLRGKGGKLLKTPKDTKSEVLCLQSDEPFDAFKAQLLALFSRNYKSVKNKDSWRWYDVRWSVARTHPTPTGLRTEDHFTIMLGKATPKGEVKIQMTERSKGYRDDDSSSSSPDQSSEDERPSKKRRSKKGKGDEIPAHEAEAAELQIQLDEKWQCPDSKCPSKVCWIAKSHGNIHIPLTAKEFTVWTTAIMKGPDCATLDSPPNHHFFDPDPNSRSPLVANRQVNSAAQRDRFQGPPIHMHNYMNGASTPVNDQATSTPTAAPQPLARVHRGAAMPLAEFATTFGLQQSVMEKFCEHDILDAESLNYLSVDQIRETLKLSIGEFGNFLAAKAKWEIANN